LHDRREPRRCTPSHDQERKLEQAGYIDGPTAPPPGTGSFDRTSGSILGMFDFDGEPDLRRLILDPITGTVVQHN